MCGQIYDDDYHQDVLCRNVFKTLSNIYEVVFCKNCQQLMNRYFCKKAPSLMFDKSLNVALLCALKKYSQFSLSLSLSLSLSQFSLSQFSPSFFVYWDFCFKYLILCVCVCVCVNDIPKQTH